MTKENQIKEIRMKEKDNDTPTIIKDVKRETLMITEKATKREAGRTKENYKR